MDTVAYELEGSLYLNVTNRCTAACSFCTRGTSPRIGPYDLRLRKEPTLQELRMAAADAERYREVVFCGYGEPTLRLDVVTALAAELHGRGISLRLNTNGHGNLIHRRNIVPELARSFPSVSVSLNAADAPAYRRLCRPRFGLRSYGAVLDFTRNCRRLIPRVVVTVVDVEGVDIGACRQVAADLGVPLRVRRYYEHIRTSDRFEA